MSGLLVVRNVSKRYPREVGEPIPVLHDVSFELEAGATLAIVGPSGSGKSTLLQLCGTLDRPDSGSISLAGADVGALDDAALARVRRTDVGFVFQRHHLLPQCTALENVLVPSLAWAKRGDREEVHARARSLLERVGLADRLHHRPGSLSGGECQRVAVARALLHRPKLLLGDEPTGALDRANADAVTDLLLELNRTEGVALLLVTHAERVASRLARACELEAGVLRAAGRAA